MDRILRAQVIATVRDTMRELLEGADEVWLTAEKLSERFGMLSPEWLRRYGELLPREKVGVVMPNGSVKLSRWAYPAHKINRMIKEGKLKELVKTTAATV